MTQPVEPLVLGAARIVGLAAVGGGLAAAAAAGYRWYARERMPDGLGLLLSLGAVALYLNTDDAFRQAMGGQRGVFDLEVALVNVVTFVAAAVVAPAAVRAGDRFATSVTAASGARQVDGEVSRLVSSVGRVITVELPEEIEDMPAYDPVDPERKATLAGRTLVFPRRLTVAELRERVVERLKTDYGIGHVDLELAADGSVEYLAVGSRAAGIGPTLPPRTVAVAVRADPPFAAGAGDLVQVYDPGGPDRPPERVVTAELRATAGDVVTLAVDQGDAERLDDTTRYRLATLPATPRAGHEFAGLLRAADETMAAVRVAAGSALDGATAGDVGAVVVAVRGEAGIEALPARDRTLAAGDLVYAVARPDELREVERAAGSPAEAVAASRDS